MAFIDKRLKDIAATFDARPGASALGVVGGVLTVSVVLWGTGLSKILPTKQYVAITTTATLGAVALLPEAADAATTVLKPLTDFFGFTNKAMDAAGKAMTAAGTAFDAIDNVAGAVGNVAEGVKGATGVFSKVGGFLGKIF